VKVLQAWAKEAPVTIEPLYILSPDQVQLPTAFFGEVHDDLMTSGREKLTKALSKLKLPGLQPVSVVVSPNYSLRSAVHTLINHARRTQATLIVASTMSKKGVPRFLFGSFAETLVLMSDIPVLLVSPKTQPARAVRHILFPTDLSPKSNEVFETVLSLAAEHRSKLTLFHKVEYLTDFSSPAFAPETYQKFFDEDLLRRQRELSQLADTARARGLKVDIVMNKRGTSIVEAIVSAVRKQKSDLVALASQTGPVTTALLGSVTRQLVRTCPSPVWVVHPDKAGEVNPNRIETVRGGRK
jgi:nucleotide-binding universal stress UspA family protein